MILDWDNCPEASRNPNVLGGTVVFKHTRLPIASLFGNMALGATIDEFVEWYPGVKKEQVEAVLKYAAESLNVENLVAA